MRLAPFVALIVVYSVMATVRADAPRSDLPQRQELNRAALTTSPDMEVITSVTEFKKGTIIARHFHHGTEAGYVLQGSKVQYPGKEPTMLQTGSTFMNLRDVPHSGFTVVGDQSLILLTVHAVDKNKPLYEWVN
jgi:quercetin dioxygenase-like cupin family protein